MDEEMAMTSDRWSLSALGGELVRMAARRFWIELTRAEDWVLRYGWGQSELCTKHQSPKMLGRRKGIGIEPLDHNS